MSYGKLWKAIRVLPEERQKPAEDTAIHAISNHLYAWDVIARRAIARGNEFWVLPIVR